MAADPPVRWAPRVQPHKLRRLYELDAQGILDEELLDDVGYALYSRCQSILHVSSAMLGNVHCPRCDTIIRRQGNDPSELLHCPTCDWETVWAAYHNTYCTQELGAGGAWEMFQAFVEQWAVVRTPRAKMLLIDQLIHRWHWQTQRQRPKFGLGRPTGVNLIEGNKQQVLALLDTLTYGAASTPGTAATKAAWRVHWQEVQARGAASRTKLQAKRAAHQRDNEGQ